ncbi:MAG: gfo/Idh/MocA family oxidoreductase [Candidatus Omnitrophota bacterium]|jgi:predicted dehydrogenase|nr:MAG: gfo/Idh/MocA family oxidoreductase [Candidatus Omnitrophota bacterium]
MTTKKSNRRGFLAGAAGIGAASLLLPPTRVMGANDRIGVGVIGVGGRGNALLGMALRRAENQQDVEVRAVCDVYQRNLTRAAERASGSRQYVHHQELLDRADIDAVMIGTPDHWHAPITLLAMEKGKDVYCEKPMTHTVAEAKEVARKTKECNRILQIGVQALSWTKWHKAKEAIDKGMLGKIVCCQGTYSRNVTFGDWNYYEINPNAGPNASGEDHIDWEQWLGSAPKRPYDADRFFRFRKYWDYSGGIATDLHYHTVAPFHLAIGNEHPTRVVGMGGIWAHDDGREVPDTFLTAADYPGKFSLTVQSSQANSVGPRTLIRGEKATMYCGADWEGEEYGQLKIVSQEPFKDEFKEKWGQEEIIIPDIKDEGDMKHVDNFFDCVRSRRQPNCHVDIAYKTMTVIGLSVRSYREGIMFYFDAEREEIITREG